MPRPSRFAALLALALAVLGLLSGVAAAAPHAVFLFSYEPGWWGVVDEDRGLIQGLAEAGYVEGQNLRVTRLYMNSKTVNKTPERMEAAAAPLLAELRRLAPDLLFILDDDALRHVGAKLLGSPLPVVFAGVNCFPTEADYGWADATRRVPLAQTLERPGYNVTGVLERVSLGAGFKLLHQVVPGAKTALFLSDASPAGTRFLQAAGGEAELANAPIRVVEKFYTDRFEDLQAKVREYQDQVDCIVLFLPWTLEDAAGRPVPPLEVVGWLLRNNRHPEVAYLPVLAEMGYLCGVVVDMVQQGFHAGVLGARILRGARPADLPIVDPVAHRIAVNLARAHQLGIDVPFEVLKAADVVHQTMTAWPEYRLGR